MFWKFTSYRRISYLRIVVKLLNILKDGYFFVAVPYDTSMD